MNAISTPRRIWTHCEAEQIDSQLDSFCLQSRRLNIPYGYLTMRAPLISNVNVLENLWLPHAWLHGWRLSTVTERLQFILECSHLVDASPSTEAVRTLANWLHLRPADLQKPQCEAAVVLRAALASPSIVVIDPTWTSWDGAIRLLDQVTWWMPVHDAVSVPGRGWVNLSYDDALRSLLGR
jgi:hypothetical protein